jgi:lipopolysaccharide export system protein LptA
MAQELPGNSEDRERIFDVLPDGSQLKGVMLPRYDKNRKLVGVLKSKIIRLVNSEELAGEAVTIEFFNDDQTPRGRIDLAKATFLKQKGLLVAKEAVDIRSDRLTARGSALHYSFEDAEGFLSGPVTTIIQAPTETTMKSKSPSIRATAAIGMSLLSQSLPAAPPPPITAKDKAAIRADAASLAPSAAKAVAATRASLKQDIAEGDAATAAATRFLVQADLPAPAAEEEPAPAVPMEFKPGPNDSTISCEGGMYFDPEEGVLVYLKNVVVKDRRFHLTAKDQLKIFFPKKPAKEKKADQPDVATGDKPEDKKKEKDLFGASIGVDFGEPERIIATGAVLFEQQQTEPDQKPIKASGAIFSYNLKADQVVISGGKPWITQPPSTYLQAQESDLSLRISPKAGTFVTEGHWEMGGAVPDQDSKKKKDN